MIQTKILIGIGVLIGLLLFKQTKPLFLKAVLIGLSVSYGLGYFAEFPMGTVSFILFGVFALVFSVWCGLYKKWIGMIIGIFTVLSYIFKLIGFPYAYELKLAMLIPIISYALIFRNLKAYRTELSILTILVSYEISELIQIIQLWID